MVSVVPASCCEREAMVEAEAERQKEEAIVVAIAAPQLATIPWKWNASPKSARRKR
jgi:hypothetical protein